MNAVDRTVVFSFDISQVVTIRALGLPGTVIAQMRDSEGMAYRVVYWSDGDRKADWLFSWEVEA